MKIYTSHVSTLPRSIIDKTTAKKRWSLPKIVFLDVETTFRYTFPSGDLQCLPLAIPEFFAHNMGIRLLANHSFHSPSQPRSKIHNSKKLELLQNDPDPAKIFPQPPLISFKRDKNIGNFFVRSAF